MSTNAYIKYLTQQLVQYFSLTKSERKDNRQHKKNQRPSSTSIWFGMLPVALSMIFKKVSK